MLYDAFLSYSHAADGKLAPALQTGLQQFAKPWNRLRAIRVFRDKTGLSATPGLWSAIETVLNNSEYFILLASPQAAESHWVRKELEHWLGQRPATQILVALTGGEIVWNAGIKDFNWELTTAVPPGLRGRFSEEPLWVDFRWARTEDDLSLRNPPFRDLVADLSSALRGIPKDQLNGEDVRQHRKAVLLRRGAISALTVLALGLGLTAFIARQNAVIARKNEQAATENAARAQKNQELAESNLKLAKENERRATENEQKALANERKANENAADARRQAERALARQLGAESDFLLRGRRQDLPRATLLATEAALRYPSLEMDQALRNALAILPHRKQEIDTGGPVKRAIFGPQARRLLLEYEKGVRVWDLVNHQAGGVIQSDFRSPGVIALSRSGERVAIATECELKVYDAKTARQLAAAPWSESRTCQLDVMVFSPDSRMIAVSGDYFTRVWNVETAQVHDLPYPRYPLGGFQSLDFSPDGKLVAGVSLDSIAVWSTVDWTRRDLQPGPPWSYGESVLFSADGEYIGAATAYGVVLWPVRLPQPRLRVPLPGDRFTRAVTIAFNEETYVGLNRISPGEIIAASENSRARVWEVWDPSGLGKEIAQFEHQGVIRSMAFSADANHLLTVSDDGTAGVWETHGGKEVARIVHPVPVLAAAFGPGGDVWSVDSAGVAHLNQLSDPSRVVAVNGAPQRLTKDGAFIAVRNELWHDLTDLWDLRAEAGGPGLGRKGTFLASWDGGKRLLAARYDKNAVQVEDLVGGRRVLTINNTEFGERTTFDTFTNGAKKASFSPDGNYFAITGSRYAHVWELASGRNWDIAGEDGGVHDFVISPDSRRAAGCTPLGSVIRVVELSSGRLMKKLPFVRAAGELNVELIFSEDGRSLATRYPFRVWDLQSRKHAEVFTSKSEGGIAFTPDSASVLSVGLSGLIMRRLATGHTRVLRWEGWDGGAPSDFVPSPADLLIAFVSKNAVILQNLLTGAVGRLEHPGVRRVVFSPDGKCLATGSFDGLVRVWDPLTAREVVHLQYDGDVTGLVFSPDCKWLAVAAEKLDAGRITGSTYVASLRLDPRSDPCPRLSRNLTADEWRQYLVNVPRRDTCPASKMR